MRARPDPVALVDCRGRAGVLSNRVVVREPEGNQGRDRRRRAPGQGIGGDPPQAAGGVDPGRAGTGFLDQGAQGPQGDGRGRRGGPRRGGHGPRLRRRRDGAGGGRGAGRHRCGARGAADRDGEPVRRRAAPAHRAGGRRRTGDLRPAAGRGHRPLQRPDLHGDGRGRSGRGHDRRDRSRRPDRSGRRRSERCRMCGPD